MMARAVAAQTKSTFLKLAGPQLVQMFIGDGAKLVSFFYYIDAKSDIQNTVISVFIWHVIFRYVTPLPWPRKRLRLSFSSMNSTLLVS